MDDRQMRCQLGWQIGPANLKAARRCICMLLHMPVSADIYTCVESALSIYDLAVIRLSISILFGGYHYARPRPRRRQNHPRGCAYELLEAAGVHWETMNTCDCVLACVLVQQAEL